MIGLLAGLCLCGGVAGPYQPAVRLDPPPPAPVVVEIPQLWSTDVVNGHCVGFEFLLGYYSPGWDARRMSGIMYRESRCQPTVARSDSGSTGLLQILRSHCGWLSSRVDGPCNLTDPVYNIRAGAALWREQGYGAWSTA